jgi:hypothetical protein
LISAFKWFCDAAPASAQGTMLSVSTTIDIIKAKIFIDCKNMCKVFYTARDVCIIVAEELMAELPGKRFKNFSGKFSISLDKTQ